MLISNGRRDFSSIHFFLKDPILRHQDRGLSLKLTVRNKSKTKI